MLRTEHDSAVDRVVSLSLFFPAHNEEDNIAETIRRAQAIAPRIAERYEIMVVDDGSTDNTPDIVQDIATQDSHVRLIRHPCNLGYGAAVKSGIQASTGDYLFLTDADLQFDIGELGVFIRHIPKYDSVIGFRAPRRDPRSRILIGKLWGLLNRVLFGLRARDIDCAFKLIRRDSVSDMMLRCHGQGISAEILLRLQEKNALILELPVSHFPRLAGRQSGASTSAISKALWELPHLYAVIRHKPRAQLFRFVAVGCVNTTLTLALYIFLSRFVPFFVDHLLITNSVAYMAGTFLGFLLHKYWTFQDRQRIHIRVLVRFYVTVFSGLALDALLFRVGIEIGLYDMAAFLVALCVSAIWNFLWLRWWVFSRKHTVFVTA